MTQLQILIPQYNENEEKIKPLLDSIAMQQDINLKEDIEVFIGNDGSDVKLSIEFLKQYPFRIQYHYFEHTRLAGTRQKLFDLVTAPYVMWCDADDQFISTIALSLILSAIKQSFDALICDFLEQHNFINKPSIYLPHKNDVIFVHGKVYNVSFLHENQIKWHPELYEHQDSAFNVLARICAKNVKQINVPIYMWCDNPESISRKNLKEHLPNTWPHMIDSFQALINDLKDRGYGVQACYYSKYALYDTYYEMAHEIWGQPEIENKCQLTYKRLKEFYVTNELLIHNCNQELTEKIIKILKPAMEKRGKLRQMPPFEQWINSILTLY